MEYPGTLQPTLEGDIKIPASIEFAISFRTDGTKWSFSLRIIYCAHSIRSFLLSLSLFISRPLRNVDRAYFVVELHVASLHLQFFDRVIKRDRERGANFFERARRVISEKWSGKRKFYNREIKHREGVRIQGSKESWREEKHLCTFVVRLYLFSIRDQAGIYVSCRTLMSSLLSNSKNYHQRTRKINIESRRVENIFLVK